MLDHLLNGVLPIFAVGALGFAFGRRGTFDFAMAMALNRFVMFAAIPALAIRLLTRAPLEEFDLSMLAGYLLIELVMYGGGFAIGRYLFRTDVREAALLGLALALTNHFLFVLPIAIVLFGEAAATQIIAIVTMDGVLVFSGTVILMDILSSKGLSAGQTLGKIARNPPVIATVFGFAAGLLDAPIPKGVDVFLQFLGAAASPVLLFALGVILSQRRSDAPMALPAVMTGMKLVVHPLLALGMFSGVLQLAPEIANPAVMVAAAPCGTMAFMLAMNYGVRVEAIARAILFTSIGSLLTVSLAAGL